MAQSNQNRNQPFWEFIQSMDNMGIDPSASANAAPNVPPQHRFPRESQPEAYVNVPPHPGRPVFPPQSAPFVGGPAGGAFNRGTFGGPGWRGRHGGHHGGHPEFRGHPPPGGFGGRFDDFNDSWNLGGERHGRGGRRGRHHRRHRSLTPSSSSSRSSSRSPSPHTERATEDETHTHTHTHNTNTRGPPHHGGRRARRERGHPRGPPPPHFPENISEFITNFTSNPIARNFMQNFIPQTNTRNGNGTDTTNEPANDETSFTPPLDLFTTPTTYTIHVSLPGAKKEDIGVHYTANTSTLTISGVVYRPCSEEFLATMTTSERRVGAFERNVDLKGDDGGEVDGEGINAKMEDGVLIVTVPRVDKEWEDIKTVEID